MSLQHLILGVLKYRPLTGYDLNKAFQSSVQHFWNTDQSQIYRALYKLHEHRWIDVEVSAQADSPLKKLYSLTETGHAELRRWLTTPAPLASIHEAWLGQIFFGAELHADEIRALLESRIAALQALLEVFTRDIPISAQAYAEAFDAKGDLQFWLLTLEYGRDKLLFDLRWAQQALEYLPK
jgi:DNA-binding PadR family transcriptional regulator